MPAVKLLRKLKGRSGVEYFQSDTGTLYRASLKPGELKEFRKLRALDPELPVRYKDDPVGLLMLVKKSRAH